MEKIFSISKERSLLNHPLYQAWVEGKLTLPILQDYAEQYFAHVEAFPQYIENAMNHCSLESAKKVLQENLADEQGQYTGVSHPQLWLQFAEGVGANPDKIKNTSFRSAICNVVSQFSKASNASFAEAIGALYAYESQVPEIAQSKIEGLKKHYGISNPKTLAFFEVHKTADKYHREALEKIIASFSAEEKEEAEKAAEKACSVLWDFLTDIENQSKKELTGKKLA